MLFHRLLEAPWDTGDSKKETLGSTKHYRSISLRGSHPLGNSFQCFFRIGGTPRGWFLKPVIWWHTCVFLSNMDSQHNTTRCCRGTNHGPQQRLFSLGVWIDKLCSYTVLPSCSNSLDVCISRQTRDLVAFTKGVHVQFSNDEDKDPQRAELWIPMDAKNVRCSEHT